MTTATIDNLTTKQLADELRVTTRQVNNYRLIAEKHTGRKFGTQDPSDSRKIVFTAEEADHIRRVAKLGKPQQSQPGAQVREMPAQDFSEKNAQAETSAIVGLSAIAAQGIQSYAQLGQQQGLMEAEVYFAAYTQTQQKVWGLVQQRMAESRAMVQSTLLALSFEPVPPEAFHLGQASFGFLPESLREVA